MIHYKNTIIYLIGFAGVGKYTIATEICAQTHCRLIDNHLINNVVFSFVREDGGKKLPPEIWRRTQKIRTIALDTMVDLGNRDFSYVFTNQLRQDDQEDWQIYNAIESAATKMNSLFVPICLECDPDENKKRIVSADRAALYKATSEKLVDQNRDEKPLQPTHKNTLNLNVTRLSANKAAHAVLKHVSTLYGE